METKLLSVAVAVAFLISCGGGHVNCQIGSLTGTWRLVYSQVDGNCGPIPSETVQAGTVGAASSCVIQNQTISPDHCRIDSTFTCPTTDGQGTQAWTTVFHQDSDTSLSGTGTVQVNHPTLGTCRSTYNLTMTKL
jgi:hypothetical protein